MAFHIVERIGKPRKREHDPDAVSIIKIAYPRSPGRDYLRFQIGAAVARAMGLFGKRHNVDLAVGTGDHSGLLKIRVAVAGGFVASCNPSGSYWIAVNRASAKGLFAFDTFHVLTIGPVDQRFLGADIVLRVPPAFTSGDD